MRLRLNFINCALIPVSGKRHHCPLQLNKHAIYTNLKTKYACSCRSQGNMYTFLDHTLQSTNNNRDGNPAMVNKSQCDQHISFDLTMHGRVNFGTGCISEPFTANLLLHCIHYAARTKTSPLRAKRHLHQTLSDISHAFVFLG